MINAFGNDDGLDLADSSLGRRASFARHVWDDCTVAAEVHRARTLLQNRPLQNTTMQSFEFYRAPQTDRGQLASNIFDQRVNVRQHQIGSPVSWWPLAILALAVLPIAIWMSGTTNGPFVGQWQLSGQLGVPVMLLGLFTLVAGMMLQLRSIRRESQAALDRMRLVELRLQEYRQAALLVNRDQNAGRGINGILRPY
jgi:hypothetical protein